MRHDNPTQVAEAFIAALNDEEMRAVLTTYEGDPQRLFEVYLADWVKSDPITNVPYVNALGAELQRIGKEHDLWEEES